MATWGGARPNSGPKPRDGLKSVAVVPAKGAKPGKHWFSKISMTHLGRRKRRDETADLARLFAAAVPPPGVLPANTKPMAMDSMAVEQATWAGSILGQVVANGLTFMGYPYLAELAQRPEYRVISDCIATECTRKWIKIKGKSDSKEEQDERDFESGVEPARADDEAPKPDKQRTADRIKQLEDDQDRLEVRDRFTELTALDGYFGRAHLFLDMGADLDATDGELAKPIGDGRNEMSKGKVERGSLKRLQVVEPVWTYPQLYNAINPLKKDWYQPTSWYVMGKHVDGSRLLTFVGQPVPDMLKPAYSFGGLSRSQMAKPYVDYWLRNRDSVGNIINAFSCFVLKTDMSTILQDSGTSLGARLDMFNALRDNQGVIALNHDSEDFVNVAAPLGTLDALLAQSQEHMAAVARIPLVKLLGISPKGLNATAEGELRSFYDTINAFQRRFMGPNVERVLNFQQLSLWGEVDPDITYEFEPLWSLDEKAEAEVQKTKAETDKTYIDSGVLHPEEVRQRVANDPSSGHDSIDVEDVPDLAEEEEQGLQPGGKVPGGEGGEGGEVGGDSAIIPFGLDEWHEAAHPRGQPGNAGQFGPGGSGGGKFKAPQLGLPYGPTSHGPGESSSFFARRPPAPIDPKSLKQVGEQKGSNPGGVFEDAEGEKFYVKQPKSKDHVRNELTAAALYALAGSPTLEYVPVEGGAYVATKMRRLDKDRAGKLSPEEVKEARKDFATHAWLGNYDAVGMGGDNLGTVRGVPTALDLGGALEYRAQGAPKGDRFGAKVGELDSLRDPKINPDAAKVFGAMTENELIASARRVTEIDDDDVRDAVEDNGGKPELAEKLIARKNDIARRVEQIEFGGKPQDKGTTVRFAPGEDPPVAALNGVAFDHFEPPEDWADVDGQAEVDEPELPETKKLISSGVIVREKDGRTWIMKPEGGFGGYDYTFPKGRAEPGLSLQANAIKEAWEETGLKVRIVGYAGDHEGDVTMTRFYAAERVGGTPADAGEEAAGVVLAPPARLAAYLNRDRDRAVAKAHAEMTGDEWQESKHPRVKGGEHAGEFAAGGGTGGSAAGGSAGGTGGSKKEAIKNLLHKGTTTAEVLKATGWPSVSMPQQAKAAGMKLEKSKGPNGETIYKGVPMTDAEKAMLKAMEAQAKKEKQTDATAKGVAAIVKAAPAPAPTSIPQPKIAKSPATPQEIEKAKKNIKLQYQFVPGPKPELGDGASAAAKLIDEFNKKYEGKTLTAQADLATKVHDFKMLTAQINDLAKYEETNKAELQKKAAAQQQKKNAEAAAQLKKAQDAAKAQNKQYMDELGISETEAMGFHALVGMMGGASSGDMIQKFKKYQSDATAHGYQITGFQYALIRNYIDGGYKSINDALRTTGQPLSAAQHVYTRLVNSAIDKLPKYSGTVVRGTSLTPAQIAAYQPGHVIEERGFTSTGIDYKFGGNVHYTIKANGKRGGDFSKGANQSEKEVLFKAHTFFMVHKVQSKGGTTYIEMEEVEGHG